jgi:hypothetical protein
MTEFQKEVAVVGMLLAFLFASFFYAETAHTGRERGNLASNAETQSINQSK